MTAARHSHPPTIGSRLGLSRTTAATLLVIGARASATSLVPHLPADWSIRRADALPAAPEPDIVLIYDATGHGVAAARRHFPGSSVLGVVSDADPVDAMVEVLEAGAHACVREGPAAVLAGHLVACQRRRPQTRHRA